MATGTSRGAWRKSARSSSTGDNCVQAAPGPTVAVRDSKNPGGGQLRVSAEQWGSFAAAVKAGKF